MLGRKKVGDEPGRLSREVEPGSIEELYERVQVAERRSARKSWTNVAMAFLLGSALFVIGWQSQTIAARNSAVERGACRDRVFAEGFDAMKAVIVTSRNQDTPEFDEAFNNLVALPDLADRFDRCTRAAGIKVRKP